MSRYRVRIVEDAEQDLIELYTYVATHDSVDKADHLLDALQELCLGLDAHPTRGHVPPELERIGLTEYREVHYKPYRIIYQIVGRDVYVHCVLDGRRDMQTLLERRLFR